MKLCGSRFQIVGLQNCQGVEASFVLCHSAPGKPWVLQVGSMRPLAEANREAAGDLAANRCQNILTRAWVLKGWGTDQWLTDETIGSGVAAVRRKAIINPPQLAEGGGGHGGFVHATMQHNNCTPVFKGGSVNL